MHPQLYPTRVQTHDIWIMIHFMSLRLSFVLFSDTLSQQGHSVSCTTILFSFFANHHSRHQAKSKMAVNLVDSRWSLYSSGVCVGTYG